MAAPRPSASIAARPAAGLGRPQPGAALGRPGLTAAAGAARAPLVGQKRPLAPEPEPEAAPEPEEAPAFEDDGGAQAMEADEEPAGGGDVQMGEAQAQAKQEEHAGVKAEQVGCWQAAGCGAAAAAGEGFGGQQQWWTAAAGAQGRPLTPA